MSDRDQQFVLRWHYHETTLLQNLPCMLENEILSDVTLSVGAQNLKAHKIILAMCSVYFLQLFQELRNTTHPVVVLHNVSIEDIRAVLAFIYRGQCVVSKDQLPSLLSVAKLLKIQGLCDMKVPDKEIQTLPENIPALNQINRDYYNTQQFPEKYYNNKNNKTENPPYSCDTQRNINQLRNISPPVTYFDHNTNLRGQENIVDDNDNDVTHEATDLTSDSRKRTTTVSPSWEKPSLVTPILEPNFPNEDTSASTLNPYPPASGRIPSPSNQKLASNKPPNSKDISETCKCFLCGKYLSNQYNLRVHMETHEEAYHACQSCPHVSRSRDALRKHVSYRHPEEYQTRKRKKTDN